MLEIAGISKSFGALKASDNLSCTVKEGEFHALIGPNGAGKTTLISQICGETAPDRGRIFFNADDITKWPVHKRVQAGLVRSYQITSVFPEFSVRENITLAALAREGNVFSMWAPARGNGETNTKVQGYITDAGMDPVAETKACELSHGKRRQLEISMAMASSPHMLLLDEPMAGMGHKEGHDMLHMLSGLKGRITTLLVEHDMDIVFSLADTITVLAAGKVIASGAPEYISKHPEVKRVYLGEGE